MERDARILKALKHNLKQFSLLRVHVCCLKVVDAEKAIVKFANIILQKVAALCRHTAGAVHALWVIEAVDIESRYGNVALGGSALGNQVPKLTRGGRPSR